MTFSCFRTLLSIDVERPYAVELIGDIAWKLYETWGRLPLAIARLYRRDPREQLRMCVNLFLRFPFGPPGYRFNRLLSSEGIALDMRVARRTATPDSWPTVSPITELRRAGGQEKIPCPMAYRGP